MKLKRFVILVIILAFTQIFCSACGYTKVDENVTLCVYADSRNTAAENVATAVASVVSQYLREELASVDEYDLHSELIRRKDCIEAIADSVLRRRGFGYGAHADCDGNTVTVFLGCGNGAAITETYNMQDDSLYKSVIAEIVTK